MNHLPLRLHRSKITHNRRSTITCRTSLSIAYSLRLAASFGLALPSDRNFLPSCSFLPIASHKRLLPPVVAHSHHHIRFPVNFEHLIFCLMQIWGALLGGCRIHKNVELASKIGQMIGDLNLEDDKVVAYLVLLSNVYASAKRWKDVANVREYMVKMELKKPPGRSWI